ncbi:hypothetical protein GH741_08185 [Aquibacillus halophilus]|uniref:PepSY domain-containing protein n=1 Tax=Aquibacillus halophilus TaxID=930132 RepID=A0A6A8DA85_9BACI|nr:PepSY domain-containing protein [Aquibacillus halophilus]MRH42663.1 hypothetical protein [Aquibacillus halophilus]
MKNRKFISIVGALVIVGGAFGIYQLTASPASASLSEEEARTKAQNQFPGEVVEIELDENGKNSVYEVEIEGTDRSYELLIDANSGEILHLEEDFKGTNKTSDGKDDQERSTDDDSSNDDTNDDKNVTLTEKSDDNADGKNENTTDKNDDDADDSETNVSKKSTNTKTPISSEKAKEIALAEVNGTITEIELDEDDGYLTYEIELVTDKNEVDIDIDAYTGAIIAVSLDDLDD